MCQKMSDNLTGNSSSGKFAVTNSNEKLADIISPSKLGPHLFLDQLKVDGGSSIIVMVGRMWDVNSTIGRYLSTDFVVSESKVRFSSIIVLVCCFI